MSSNNQPPVSPPVFYPTTTLSFHPFESLSYHSLPTSSEVISSESSQVSSLPTPLFPSFSPFYYSDIIEMENLEGNLGHRGDFTEEICPEDSVSQTFHYSDQRIPSIPLHDQSMEIDHTMDETASSTLSAPPSSLLTPSAAAYSDAGEYIEFSSEVPDTSQIPAAFLAKRKKRTAYCWLPCNGIEYFDRRTECWRWKCARCLTSLFFYFSY